MRSLHALRLVEMTKGKEVEMTKGKEVEMTLKDFPRNRWWFRGNFVISQP